MLRRIVIIFLTVCCASFFLVALNRVSTVHVSPAHIQPAQMESDCLSGWNENLPCLTPDEIDRAFRGDSDPQPKPRHPTTNSQKHEEQI
jgi:hypothetical protein